MPEPADLTDFQLAILSVLWDRREATVAEVYEVLQERSPAARKTIATLLDRLERRGLVKHRVRDRENVYRATVSKRKVVMSRISGVLGALFGPAATARSAGARAVDASEVRPGDVDRVLELLRRAQRDVRDME
jgi:predicted transcriptional regulator